MKPPEALIALLNSVSISIDPASVTYYANFNSAAEKMRTLYQLRYELYLKGTGVRDADYESLLKNLKRHTEVTVHGLHTENEAFGIFTDIDIKTFIGMLGGRFDKDSQA